MDSFSNISKEKSINSKLSTVSNSNFNELMKKRRRSEKNKINKRGKIYNWIFQKSSLLTFILCMITTTKIYRRMRQRNMINTIELVGENLMKSKTNSIIRMKISALLMRSSNTNNFTLMTRSSLAKTISWRTKMTIIYSRKTIFSQ